MQVMSDYREPTIEEKHWALALRKLFMYLFEETQGECNKFARVLGTTEFLATRLVSDPIDYTRDRWQEAHSENSIELYFPFEKEGGLRKHGWIYYAERGEQGQIVCVYCGKRWNTSRTTNA